MAVLCGACSTENRDGAKFCKGCGARLAPADATTAMPTGGAPGEWPATVPTPLRASAVRPDTVTVIAGAAPRSAPPAPSPAPAAPPLASTRARAVPAVSPRAPAAVPSLAPARPSVPVPLSPHRRAARSRSIKVGTGLLVTLLLAAAAVWYLLDNSGRSERPPAMTSALSHAAPASAVPVPVPALSPPAAPETVAAAPASPAPTLSAAAPPAPVAAPRPAPTTAQTKPRKPAAA